MKNLADLMSLVNGDPHYFFHNWRILFPFDVDNICAKRKAKP